MAKIEKTPVRQRDPTREQKPLNGALKGVTYNKILRGSFQRPVCTFFENTGFFRRVAARPWLFFAPHRSACPVFDSFEMKGSAHENALSSFEQRARDRLKRHPRDGYVTSDKTSGAQNTAGRFFNVGDDLFRQRVKILVRQRLVDGLDQHLDGDRFLVFAKRRAFEHVKHRNA
jgi:hypothetical protein